MCEVGRLSAGCARRSLDRDPNRGEYALMVDMEVIGRAVRLPALRHRDLMVSA